MAGSKSKKPVNTVFYGLLRCLIVILAGSVAQCSNILRAIVALPKCPPGHANLEVPARQRANIYWAG